MVKITGIMDINNPRYPFLTTSDTGEDEGHLEPPDNSLKSNVVDYEHPIFSGNGLIRTINFSRNHGNTKEEELEGTIKNKIFEDVTAAAKQYKVPADILLFICDWEKDLTKRSDASDASSYAQKIVEYIPQLTKLLGRDPLNAEVFAAHALGSAQEVYNRWKLSIDNPDEEATNAGTKKDDIIFNKQRNKIDKKRTNREVYDFFYRRIPFGKVLFKNKLGKDKYGN